MDVLENGFLGLTLDQDTSTMIAIDIAAHTVVLAMQIVVGMIALKKMTQRKNLNKLLNFMFIFSLFCACTYTASEIIEHVFSDDIPLFIILFCEWMCFGFFFVSLLATLVFRLHITFKESTYRMSSALIIIFSVIMVAGSLGWIVLSAVFVYKGMDHIISFSLGFFLVLLYILGSTLAVYFFVERLHKLAQDRETSVKDVHNVEQNDIRLDRMQQRFSDLAAKYMMLFGLAAASTILLNFLSMFVNIKSGLRSQFWALDLFVNLCCLFLQFSFAKDHYKKWCGCCDRKSRNYVSKRTKYAVQDRRRTMSIDWNRRKSTGSISTVSHQSATVQSAIVMSQSI